MSVTFHKILEDKIREIKASSKNAFSPTKSTSFREEPYISISVKPLAQTKHSFNSSLYRDYQKDQEELKNIRLQREKEVFNSFLSKISSEKTKLAAQNFYTHGARNFLSGKITDLKKDFRTLAKELHPDKHAFCSEEKKLYFHREFRILREDLDTLAYEFSRQK